MEFLGNKMVIIVPITVSYQDDSSITNLQSFEFLNFHYMNERSQNFQRNEEIRKTAGPQQNKERQMIMHL